MAWPKIKFHKGLEHGNDFFRFPFRVRWFTRAAVGKMDSEEEEER